MIIQPHQTLLFIGDSITDCGRDRPIGRGPGGLGDGYVALIDGLIKSSVPPMNLSVINVGISGNTVRDLKARWQADVLALKPDWLSIMIGINDVWRHFDSYLPDEQLVSIDEYAATLEELVRSAQPQLNGLILMTPYYLEPDRSEPMRALMDRYGSIVRSLAATYQTLFVDTQAAFDEALSEMPPTALADDRVHPNERGHLILARAFLKSIDRQ